MPIYEFECAGCGRGFEQLCFKGDDQEGLICPNCGSPQIKRVLSVFSSSSSESDLALPSSAGSCGSSSGFS